MDVMKIFQMQEPITADTLPPPSPRSSNEMNKLREIIQEKDVIINNNQEHISDLEQQIVELQNQNEHLQCDLNDAKQGNNTEFEEIMKNYDKLFYKMLMEREQLVQQKSILQNHLANLEMAFNDLLEKYERSKMIIMGFRANEEILKRDVAEYKAALDATTNKYQEFKIYAENKLSHANLELCNKDKGNIEEVAKLKAKILQSQVKISELEKFVKFDDIDSRPSIFTPLSSSHIRSS